MKNKCKLCGLIEEWVPLQANDMYSISNIGRIRNNKTKKILKHSICPKGYVCNHVRVNGVGKTYKIHRLVAIHFLGLTKKSGLHACHKDDNRAHSCSTNLFIGTNKDNVYDCIKKGRMGWRYGESASRAKLTSKQVKRIRKEYKTGKVTYKELAKKYDVVIGNIGFIIRNKTHVI